MTHNRIQRVELTQGPKTCAILMHSCLWGGAESHALGLAEALVSRGIEPTIICLDARTHELFLPAIPPGVTLSQVESSLDVRSRGYREWTKLFRTMPAGACFFEKGTLHAGSLRLEVAARRHFKTFVTIEQLEPPTLPPRTSRRHCYGLVPGLSLWWYRMRAQGRLRSLLPSKVVAVSESVRRRLRTDYDFSEAKVVTVHNGADTHRFLPDSQARLHARKLWHLPGDALVFGTARRFTYDKGIDLLLDAFATLIQARPAWNAYLVLVGDGPDREFLEHRAEIAGVSSRVRFPGFLSDTAPAYPAFDVFVLPSRNEALSLALVEAMSCGCLPVATLVGGAAEVIDSTSLGWLVTPEDTAALALAMNEAGDLALNDHQTMSQSVRNHVVNNFDANAQFAKLIDLIDDSSATIKRPVR